jgi:hypothetical protein
MTLRSRKGATRLRTGYSRATHRNKMKGTPEADCSFWSTKLTLKLWQCKETEEERRKSNVTKEVWEKRVEKREGANMLVEYVKNIGLYYGL